MNHKLAVALNIALIFGVVLAGQKTKDAELVGDDKDDLKTASSYGYGYYGYPSYGYHSGYASLYPYTYGYGNLYGYHGYPYYGFGHGYGGLYGGYGWWR